MDNLKSFEGPPFFRPVTFRHSPLDGFPLLGCVPKDAVAQNVQDGGTVSPAREIYTENVSH